MSASPAKNSVGVFTFAASFTGELLQNASNGAFFRHGVPPNQVRRNETLSLWPHSEIQFAMPAVADAALKRSVVVISLLTSVPPALIPMITTLSGSAMPLC